MGHAFQDTLMDALTRYHRMLGDSTLWQAGSDHAGIATQMVVERLINTEGKTRHDLGRETFVKRIWKWKEESGNTITQQLRRMGSSLDWPNERFTMDEGLSNAVNEVFVRLYDEGLIYRGHRLVNWDPVLHTAVSDLEVLSEEENGHMWHMRYPLSAGKGAMEVATTRPETMLGDCAVAVHPEDERYQALVGKMVNLPLTGRQIPIIADDYVDPEFGTGCVKITPAHDFNDYQVWERHRNEETISRQFNGGLINILTIDAALRDNEEEHDVIPAAYIGLDRFEARKQIVKDLEKQDLLVKIEDHRLMVPRGDRSNSIIEPFLTDQWYVRVEPLAKPAIEAVASGKIRFVPDNWKNTYFEWMNNIQDWCISRQIWWGHRIPAWYDNDNNIYVGRNEDEVRIKYKLDLSLVLRQDEDVLDTWFSSALWPFSTLGWPQQTERLTKFYPTNVLVTGFDIIFFWVARMIMMGIKFMDDVPFHEVYIHGLIRDSHGNKMSKSKGNVLDPIDLIDGIELDALVEKRTRGMMQPHLAEKITKLTRKDFPDGISGYGTDALRFTFAALASTGRDINFDLGRIEGYRNFCNKLWNASRFVLMNTEGEDCGQNSNEIEFSLADRWIHSRLQQVTKQTHDALAKYRFDHMAQSLYGFVWDEYCSWYLEAAKIVLNDPQSTEVQKCGTRKRLIETLESILRLLHPITPFITEEIWLRVKPIVEAPGDSIMTAAYPLAADDEVDHPSVSDMDWIKDIISGIRAIRGELNIEPHRRLPCFFSELDRNKLNIVSTNIELIKSLARLESFEKANDTFDDANAAIALVSDTRLMMPMAELIDKQAELARLDKEIAKLDKDLLKSKTKLTNTNFIDKAPVPIVDKERSRVEEMTQQRAELNQQLQKIQALP